MSAKQFDALCFLENGDESDVDELANYVSNDDPDEDYVPSKDSETDDDIPLADLFPSRNTKRHKLNASQDHNDDGDSDSEDDNMPLTTLFPSTRKKIPKMTARVNPRLYTRRKTTYDAPDSTFTRDPLDLPANVGTPLEYFETFIDDEMLELLSSMTNMYVLQKTGRELEVSKKELEQVIGMFFRMDLVHMPDTRRMYWETDTKYSQVADVMSRNRFQNIVSHLHFVDNPAVSEED